MRTILAVILLCALEMPAASALPAAGANPVAVSKADFFAQAAKRSRPPARRSSRNSNSANGIHPLVGSGDY
jgi:hypothetical protein